MELSIVMPTYNSALFIEEVIAAFTTTIKDIDFEIIIINDGSSDETNAICNKLSSKHAIIKYIQLSKNVGEYNAVICGLHYATGEYIAIVDDDLQNPPAELIKLYNRIKSSNSEVVYSSYKEKKYPLWRKIMSYGFNIITTILFLKPFGLRLNSFKIMKNSIAKRIIKYRGPFTFFDVFVPRLSKKISVQEVDNYVSLRGKSNYNLNSLLWISIENIFGHSYILFLLNIILIATLIVIDNNTIYFIVVPFILIIIQLLFYIYALWYKKNRKQYIIKKAIIDFHH